MLTEAVGYTAMLCASLIHVPQLVHTYRTKSAGDLSWGFVASYMVVCSLNTTYGLLIHRVPIYTANMVCMLNMTLLGIMKYKYTQRRGHDAVRVVYGLGQPIPTGEPPDDDRFY